LPDKITLCCMSLIKKLESGLNADKIFLSVSENDFFTVTLSIRVKIAAKFLKTIVFLFQLLLLQLI
jgi:hypothetical protein